MIMLQTGRTISLPCGVNDIKSFTVNHCNLYFLDRSGHKLIKWTPDTRTVETIALERKYLCICYDNIENCYWVIPECEPFLIYRLDTCFCEIGHITLKGACQQRAPVSLCCDGCGDGLWVCYPSQMVYVEKCNKKVKWYKNEDGHRINIGIIAQCQCRVNCYCEGGRQIIESTSICDEESINLSIPRECKIVGIAPCTCKCNCKDCRFCVLLSKACSHEFLLAEYCIDFSKEMIDPCYPCPPEPYPPPFPPEPHCGGIYEVMHSIALEEAGISHILNAEGEKIQKAVAMSDNIEQLVCVNESVKRTLTQVTLLEGMLYSKLEALVAGESCCKKTDPPCSTPEVPCPCHECEDCHELDYAI